MFLRVKFLALCFSICILSLCLPLLTHPLSYTVHLLMTYNYRCLLPLTKYPSYFTPLQLYISDVIAWATADMLKHNDNKTKLIFVTSKRTKHFHKLPTSITIGYAQIPFKQSVKNLSFTLDCHLIKNAHVSNISRTCYIKLRRLASIRRFLTSNATATHVSAFVLSIVGKCNLL